MRHLLSTIALAALCAGPAFAQEYQQAPMLDDMGLPPVAERLPVHPRIMTPLDQPGTYGGTLTRGSYLMIDYLTENYTREALFMWPLPLTNAGPPLPNLAESIVYSDDGTSATVTLREGMRWSDGEPFTTEDIVFYWNDIMLNDNVAEPFPGILLVDGVAPTVTALSPDRDPLRFRQVLLFLRRGDGLDLGDRLAQALHGAIPP